MLRTKTVLGDFAVEERGFEIAHKAITIQSQDGKQVVVWPDEVAREVPVPDPAVGPAVKEVRPFEHAKSGADPAPQGADDQWA
jgi:hypothetical protein